VKTGSEMSDRLEVLKDGRGSTDQLGLFSSSQSIHGRWV
jgi:hypothetical protein